MIVRITLERTREKEQFTLYFGNSYKRWDHQFQEYCWRGASPNNDFYIKNLALVRAEYCNEQFPSYGGLKWGTEEGLIQRLKEEAENNGTKPKDFTKFRFWRCPDKKISVIVKAMVNGKELADRNIYDMEHPVVN